MPCAPIVALVNHRRPASIKAKGYPRKANIQAVRGALCVIGPTAAGALQGA